LRELVTNRIFIAKSVKRNSLKRNCETKICGKSVKQHIVQDNDNVWDDCSLWVGETNDNVVIKNGREEFDIHAVNDMHDL
jgi:hypothetical protein